jgi:DNA-binding MarR family transcriptional regulator
VSDLREDDLVARWHALVSRHAAVWGALERELQQRHGIGVSEYEAMLAEAVPLSQSAASRLTARLERAGFVERGLCEMDRRGIYVHLTEEGRRRYTEARPTHRAVLAETLGLD